MALGKKCEGDVEELLDKEYIKYAKIDSKNTNLFLSDSEYQSQMFRRAFWYQGEILVCGLPRNDIFYNEEKKKEIKEKCYKHFNIQKNELVILYAPTFRNEFDKKDFAIDYPRLTKTLEKKYNKNVKILVKLHPNIAYKSNELDINYENVIDASNYKDMQELLVFSDLLISDYSSVVFDFSLMSKPSFIFATDLEDYKKERGHYVALEDLPFPITKNNDELNKLFKDMDEEQVIKKIDDFFNDYGVVKGNASNKVVDWIENKLSH